MSLIDSKTPRMLPASTYASDTQSALDTRLGNLQKMNAASAAPTGAVGVLSDPNQPTAETQRADLLSKGNSLIDSINSNSNLSGRQKGAQILAAGQGVAALGGTPDLSMPSGMSARQAGNFQVGAFNNQVSAMNRQPQAFADGGKIKGPGTPTSDTIPAQVRETGEPIAVSTDERILSKAQDDLLLRIAKALGFETVDALLESGTGKPVGPTIKGGKAAAATGAKIDPEELMQKIAATRGLDYQAPAAPTYLAPAPQEKSNLQMVGEQSTADINSVSSPGAKIHHAAKGVLAAVPAAVEDAYNFIAPKVAPLITGEDYKRAAPAQVAAAQSPNAQVAAAPPAAAPAQPGDSIKEAAGEPINNFKAPDLTTKDIVPGGYLDRGNGIVAQRGKNGHLNVTNVGTEALTDPNKRAVDDSASALIDQKNSTYNPAAQLARMQSSRMVSDATDSTITDPSTKAEAVRGAQILQEARAGDAQAKVADVQGKVGALQLDDANKLQDAYKRYLDPKTDQATRDSLYEYLMLHHGKDPNEIKIATTSLPNPNNPMGPNVNQSFAIDRKGRAVDVAAAAKTAQVQPLPKGMTREAVVAEAQKAIKAGKSAAAVQAELAKYGLNLQ